MTLTEARQALADVLSGVAGLDVRPHLAKGLSAPGDGWVTVGRVVPDDFTASAATLTAVLILGHDRYRADEQLDAIAVQVLDAVTSAETLAAADVVVEPEVLVVDQTGGVLYALTLTLTLPVGG